MLLLLLLLKKNNIDLERAIIIKLVLVNEIMSDRKKVKNKHMNDDFFVANEE